MRRKLDRFRAVSASKVVSRCCKQFWLQLVKPIAYGLQCFGFSNSSIRAKAAISSKESSAICVLCPQGRLLTLVKCYLGTTSLALSWIHILKTLGSAFNRYFQAPPVVSEEAAPPKEVPSEFLWRFYNRHAVQIAE